MNERVRETAEEFGRFARSGGWLLGAMVAHCTFTGKASDRANIPEIEAGKVTTTIFAELAGVSQATVNRYRRTWDQASEAGVVPAASTLTPERLADSSYTEADLGEWSSWFNQANKVTPEQAIQDAAPAASEPESDQNGEPAAETVADAIKKLELLLTAARAPWKIPDDKLGQAAALVNDTIGVLEDKVTALDGRLAEIHAAAEAARQAPKPKRVRKARPGKPVPATELAAAREAALAAEADAVAELPPGAELTGLDDVFGPDQGNPAQLSGPLLSPEFVESRGVPPVV
jgi:hypothetical protein